ncbi:MAG: sulfite exporter TauE/SafE family protein [Synechococcales bacterium]|nr:sulfite exporter TauE/SafE family protein [Synechococcales bacterium]
MLEVLPFLILGLAVGALSGLVGIGGGVLITPALIYLFSFDQKLAQGTTLALLVPPIGILGAWAYYREGFVDIRAAIFICSGFVLGGLVGAKYAVSLDPLLLRRIFGTSLLVVALRMIISTFSFGQRT